MDRKVLAAFDFDGTITRSDSLLPFLIYTFGFGKTVLNCIFALPWIFTSRQKVKEAILTRFIKGMSQTKLRTLGVVYVKEKLPSLLKPEAMDRLRWHQERGDRVVLVSASTDFYLAPWCEEVGIDCLVCSKIEYSEGVATGKLVGLNCRSEEKVRRLAEAVGPLNQFEIYAYGDSEGDKELLALADRSFYREMPSRG